MARAGRTFPPRRPTGGPGGAAHVYYGQFNVYLYGTPPVITEDSSAPPAGTSTGSTFTSNSFTPAANALLVAVSTVGNTSGAGTNTAAVTDSLGSTWTLRRRVNGAHGAAEVWILNAGASPAARTVTVTGAGTTPTGVSLCVKVLNGAAPVSGQTGATAGSPGGTQTTASIAITTTTVDSLPVGGIVDVITQTPAYTVNGVTTAWQTVADATNTEKYGAFRAATATTTPGSITIGFSNAAADNQAAVAVEILPAPAGGVNLSRTVSDTASATDVVTRAVVLARATSETAAATDAVTRSSTRSRSVSDTAQAVDAPTRTLTLLRATSETAAAADVASGTVFSGQSRTASDTAAATDVATRTLILARTTSDTAAAADAVTRTSARSRTTSDTAAATDATARSLAVSRPVSDTAAAADAVTRSTSRSRTTSDTAAATDSASGALGGGASRTASDTAAATDVASRAPLAFSRTAPSTAAATDGATRVVARSRTASDTASATDVVTRQINRGRTAADTALASDVATRAPQTISRTAADTALAVDVAVGVQTGGTTHRPNTGTTGRPGTGRTARPFIGTTDRP